MSHPPNVFELLEGVLPITLSTVLATLAILLLLAFVVRSGFSKDDGLIPSPKLTLRNLLELLLEGIVTQMRGTIGPEWPRYAPIVGTLGLFILVSNLMGLFPGLTGPTSFIETNVSWAILSFVVYNVAGVRHHGIAYVKHFLGPVPALAPIMFPIELITHAARILSLTVRLTANMFADHTLVAIFLSFPVVGLFLPWAMMGLGLFVAVLQAFIFTYLTMIYIGSALAEEH
jgi:F-type H+-transporting ATPase subunit a